MKPSHRHEMAIRAVQEWALTVRLACETFGVGQTCYRYQAKCSTENEAIADRLIKLTHTQRNWGFGQGDASPTTLPAAPDRPANRQCTLSTPANAALLYRLNADCDPLHADPDVARKAGYAKPILHGLCTYGVAAHAIIKTWCVTTPRAC